MESRYRVELSGREVSILVRATQADLATLRICERTDCTFAVLDGIKELKDILMAMSNHIASMHPAAGGSEGGEGSRGIQIQCSHTYLG